MVVPGAFEDWVRARVEGVEGHGGGAARIVVVFVRVSAVLLGAANVFLLAAITLWLAATGAEELEGLNGIHVVLGLFVASAAGLLAAEIILRLVRRALQGRFFSRYAAMVLGICLGGALTVLFPALFVAVPVGLAESESPHGILLPVAMFTLYGGLGGLIEGSVLALPLAALLGAVQRP